jgi:hypothetical protein
LGSGVESAEHERFETLSAHLTARQLEGLELFVGRVRVCCALLAHRPQQQLRLACSKLSAKPAAQRTACAQASNQPFLRRSGGRGDARRWADGPFRRRSSTASDVPRAAGWRRLSRV